MVVVVVVVVVVVHLQMMVRRSRMGLLLVERCQIQAGLSLYCRDCLVLLLLLVKTKMHRVKGQKGTDNRGPAGSWQMALARGYLTTVGSRLGGAGGNCIVGCPSTEGGGTQMVCRVLAGCKK